MAFGVMFTGSLRLDRPLLEEQRSYLAAFHEMRRERADVAQLAGRKDVVRTAVGLPVGPEGAFFVGEELRYNDPARLLIGEEPAQPEGQPSLFCPWMPSDDGWALLLDAGHDCVRIVEWLLYVLEHFIQPWGYKLNGAVGWEVGEGDERDCGRIIVCDNDVRVAMQQPDGSFGGQPREDISCVHKDAPRTRKICVHLTGKLTTPFCRWFVENPEYAGQETLREWNLHDGPYSCVLVCPACYQRLEAGDTAIVTATICHGCYTEVENWGFFDGSISTIAVHERDAGLSLQVETVSVPLHGHVLALQPVAHTRESIWIAVTSEAEIVRINFSQGSVTPLMKLPASRLVLDQPLRLRVSPNGDFAALVNVLDRHGLVFDLEALRVTMYLERDGYHADVSNFPLTFFMLDGRVLLVHGSEWNRLDIADPRTGKCLTERHLPAWSPRDRDGQGLAMASTHYLDYFHAGLLVSPDQQWLIDDGWVWQPRGVMVAYRLPRWLYENAWETEEAFNAHQLCSRDYWDRSACWLDGRTLAIWGYGDGDEWLLPAVRIFDVETNTELRWFPGPVGTLAYDDYLYSFSVDDALAVWDITTGERVLHAPEFMPSRYHPGARQFLRIEDGGKFTLGHLISR